MKTSFLTENLQKKLSFVNHAVSGRTQLPILSNFLVKAIKGEIIIRATDLEIGISVSVPANTEKEGETTIPAKQFFDLITSFEKEKITLEEKEGTLNITGGRTKASLQTTSTEDFPQIYSKRGEKVSEEKAETLAKEMRKIMFSASQDTGRPALSGVMLEKDGGGIILVATDGFRLSLKKDSKINIKTKEGPTLLIPARVIKETLALPELEEDIKVYISKENNQIIFSQKETEVVGRLIEAEYPEYEKILPVDFSTKTEFNKEEMLKAVKRCSVFAKDTANIIKLKIKKEVINLSANTPSVGENTVEVEAKTEGEENEIAFNIRYLLDFLNNVDAEEVVFEMNGPLNPGVFKTKGDNTFLHLIMPIKVQE